jgi:hypothetical protein
MGSGVGSSSGSGVYDSGGRRSAPQRAVPRNPASSGNAGGRSSAIAPGSGGDDRRRNPESNAVPSYSRPRDGRTPTGDVMERRSPIPNRDGNYYYPYSYYFDPYYGGYYGYGSRYGYYSPYYSRYWLPGYGFGFGYFAYDPFWYDPYYAGYGGGYGGGGYAGGYSRQYNGTGSLRLKVKPGHAQVYVDGYYVGVVDSFDGVFQRLSLDAGAHRIEIKAEGFETVQFEVNVRPGETVTYKGELLRQ